MIRSLCVNYCDDIREEVGNKTSLIGIYGPRLIVSELPTSIPKLCVFAQVAGEADKEFEEPFELRLILDEEIIASTFSHPTGKLERGHFHSARAAFVLSPFTIQYSCALRVRAYYRGVEYKAAALQIGLADEEQTALEAD